MQTFLPYSDVIKSVQCLDDKRLGKQRVEAMQILKALSNPTYGWQNHPAVKMWRGYEALLTKYMNEAINEWIRRGFKNTMQKSQKYIFFDYSPYLKMPIPQWWGGRIHETHKSNLLRKNPNFYGKFGWNVPDNLPYYWPV
jgi:hypothetical protein